MLGSPAGPGAPTQRGLWPLAPAPAPSATSFSTDGFSKYGVYSLFPGGPTFGSALYSHASTIGRFSSGMQPSSGNPFHATAHKVPESLFSSAGYTFGAPTPPPGSPYSPVHVTQLELLAKGFNSNIIIQQPDYPPSPKKVQIQEKREEKCCSLKTQKPCLCRSSPSKAKFLESSGCSRTNPVDWSPVNVKKEPGATPCQVAEITTSVSPVVKVEVASPTQKGADLHLVNGQAALTSTNDSTAGMAATAAGGVPGGGTLLQCTDERTTGLAGWPVGGAHNSTLSTPTLWQYPAPVPVEPMVPLPVPMPPVGFQLVRDPTTGGLLLLPTTTGIVPEQLQQAVVWPSYPQQASSHVLLPPLPPPPLQLLSSASSDYLSTSTTLHQHTQTHSTRLVAVTTDTKRKIPLPIPATTLIKIETDATTLDQTKTLQAVSTIGSNTGTVFTDPNMAPLVTTHVIYQHPTNLILSQPTANETACRSQATSPVTCLTPPPEVPPVVEEETLAVQDASNQTEAHIYSEEETLHETPKVSEDVAPEEAVVESTQFHVPERIEDIPEVDSSTDKILKETQSPQVITAVSEETVQQSKPDLSGLELLSNSIEEFEKCRKSVDLPPVKEELIETPIKEQIEEVLKEVAPITVKDTENEAVKVRAVDDSLAGLDLLCALAEQRIMEEVKEKTKVAARKERKREKRKSKRHSDEPRHKRCKSDKAEKERKRKETREDYHSEKAVIDRVSIMDVQKDEVYANGDNAKCSCKENYRSFKTPESEEEVRKFIASKSQTTCCKGEWPCMNAMELDMRMRLADLQRQYREKQRELSKLKPKKHASDCSKKNRSRKRSTNSDRSATPPPLLDKMDVPVKPLKDTSDLLKPPTLCAEAKLPKLEPIVIHPNDSYKRPHSPGTDVSLDSTPEKHSSYKKRKGGRPKKFMSSPGVHQTTETIVAKKPKKGNLVGYLLAAKEKLKMQTKNGTMYCNSPPRYIEETTRKHKSHKHKNNNNIILNADLEDHIDKTCKIRPKLKAEPTVKAYNEDAWETETEEEEEEEEEDPEIEEEDDMSQAETEANDCVEEDATVIKEEAPEQDDEPVEEVPKPADNRCVLTTEHLEMDKLRVLTAMGGLFYAGHLNAVEPPDVYSITLDGERGNRPHIMSREEILRDAIVEVSPSSTDELVPGTRLCAYWSQQYRCLYPGSVAEPGTPNPALDSKFVAVEFDDGDSGRIALEDIRLLPPDYPIIEYDPNPLLSLSKRRRRTSTSVSVEERRLSQTCSLTPVPQEQKMKDTPAGKEVEGASDIHRERKRLKKKKKEKLKEKLLHDDKHKKKKHKCLESHCKHKKHHKKHRKHKKHHYTKEEKEEALEEKDSAIEEHDSGIQNSDETEDTSMEGNDTEIFPEYHIVANPEDEVTMDDIIEATQSKPKSKKIRDRQESCESRSKMSAFLPARQLWGWSGKGYKRPKAKGRSRKQFYKAIQRGKESILVGDSAVFLSTGRPDRPYIGRIEAMWESCGTMVVKVKWFYHPEETVGCPLNLKYPGALFESPHVDENDVQTISHKCEVLPLKDYTEKLGDDPRRYATIYDNNDIYYLAGYYDPTTTTLKMEPGIPFTNAD